LRQTWIGPGFCTSAYLKIGRQEYLIEKVKKTPEMMAGLQSLSQRIFACAGRGSHRTDFLCEVSRMIVEFSGCDAVALWLLEGERIYRCETLNSQASPFQLDAIDFSRGPACKTAGTGPQNARLVKLCLKVLKGRTDPSLPGFTAGGSFRTKDALTDPRLSPASKSKRGRRPAPAADYRSIAVVPLKIGKDTIGILKLKSKRANFFSKGSINFYELAAQTLAFALSSRQTQAALQERVKELTCLYGISQLCEQEGVSLEVILQGIVEHLPQAWQYPEAAHGRIIFEGNFYSTAGFRDGPHKLSAEIVINGRNQGSVEVVYSEEKPELDEGPFLKEERDLIDTVAAQTELIIQRKLAEEEGSRLSEQLRHADRLATIGQLSAGVAHELNEPLGSILGFAQITRKSTGLADQAAQDLDKIIKASLHAREIIKKLMLFGRQAPMQKTRVNLNKIVDEGLYLVESRCAKEGIKLTRILAPDLPEITADPSQLNQVLINLVVNSIQAMPKGGALTVQTVAGPEHVSLVVEDSGVGMSEEQVKKIFIPFYTTKEIGQGTGLGLPVVHGIVTSHNGSIKVDSKVGQGTRFEIRLPCT